MAFSWRHYKLITAILFVAGSLFGQVTGNGLHGIIASSIQISTGGNPGLLDTVTNALPAYSTRHLLSTYSGSCLQVRRASDNSTSDIGFVGDTLDVASINTFCSGTTCYVRIWYDQSGNSLDAYGMNEATNNDNLPIIYESGSVTKLNNRVAIKITHPRAFVFTNTNYDLDQIAGEGASGADKLWSAAIVGQIGSTPTQPYLLTLNSAAENEVLWFYQDGNARIEYDASALAMGAGLTRDAQKSWIAVVNGTSLDAFENNSSLTGGTLGAVASFTETDITARIGGGSFSSRNIEGFYQEIICWKAAVNTTTVFNSQDGFYGIP